jgi:hypothetical protein
MISRIPTPNALVDTSLWPIAKITLGVAPTEDEYRVALGRMRSLRARGVPHFVIVDARRLFEGPSRYVQMRIATFVFESVDLRTGGALGVAVVSSTDAVRSAAVELGRICNRPDQVLLVSDVPTALECARQSLGKSGSLVYEL